MILLLIQLYQLDEEHIFQVLESHSAFFIYLDEYMSFYHYKLEIKDYYSVMNRLRKKIKNLFLVLAFVFICIIIIPLFFNYDIISYIGISIIIYVILDIFRLWYDFKEYALKISTIIRSISETSNKIPNFGEDIKN